MYRRLVGQLLGEVHDDREDHRRRTHHGRANQNWLRGRLESVAGTIIFFEEVLRLLELDIESEFAADFFLDVRDAFNQRQLVNRLGVVRHRTVRVDGNRHWSHAQKTERHQTECKHRRCEHHRVQTLPRHREVVSECHQTDNAHPQPVAGEITSHQTGKNVQRRATLLRRGNDLLDVGRFGRSEDFDQLRNNRPRQRAARDNRRQLPPKRLIAGERTAARHRANRHVGDHVGQGNRNNRSDPDQTGQRTFKVHFVSVFTACLGHRLVDEVARSRSNHHHHPHHENPNQQLNLQCLVTFAGHRLIDREQDEGNQGDSGHAVSLKTVRTRPHRVAGVISGAVRNHTRVSGVVFLDLEDDLHQVRTDIGNLGENTTGDSQRRRTQTLTNRKSDKAWARVAAGDKQQNAEHDQQLDANQHHPDAHTGLQRNGVAGIGLASQTGKRGPRVGEGVNPNTEPGNQVAAGDPDQGENQNHDHQI